MSRFVLIVARKDIALAFRTELQDLHGGRHGKIAAMKYRRVGDAGSTFSHFVAHGHVNDDVWAGVLTALNSATANVRDSVNWQGKPGTPVEDATWAIAYDGTDIVAGFRIIEGGARPRQVLESLDLVAAIDD